MKKTEKAILWTIFSSRWDFASGNVLKIVAQINSWKTFLKAGYSFVEKLINSTSITTLGPTSWGHRGWGSDVNQSTWD